MTLPIASKVRPVKGELALRQNTRNNRIKQQTLPRFGLEQLRTDRREIGERFRRRIQFLHTKMRRGRCAPRIVKAWGLTSAWAIAETGRDRIRMGLKGCERSGEPVNC